MTDDGYRTSHSIKNDAIQDILDSISALARYTISCGSYLFLPLPKGVYLYVTGTTGILTIVLLWCSCVWCGVGARDVADSRKYIRVEGSITRTYVEYTESHIRMYGIILQSQNWNKNKFEDTLWADNLSHSTVAMKT